MRRKRINKTIFVLLTVILAFSLLSCGNKTANTDNPTKTVTVQLSVTYPQESGKANLESYSMNVQQGATVLQVLEAYCGQNGIDVSVDAKDSYVTGINQVQASSNTGWVYEINGEGIMKGADKQTVKNGDSIVWRVVSL